MLLESSFLFFELPFGPALRWRAHCLCAESQVMPVLERPLGLLPPNLYLEPSVSAGHAFGAVHWVSHCDSHTTELFVAVYRLRVQGDRAEAGRSALDTILHVAFCQISTNSVCLYKHMLVNDVHSVDRSRSSVGAGIMPPPYWHPS